MSILVTRRTIYQVIRIRALNHRGWTLINGVYVFDSIYINHGYNYGRVSRMNSTPYMYHSNNNDGVLWMNTNPYMYHSNNNNDEVSWMNTTPYMDHGNNNNNNDGVLRVNPAPQDSIQNLERFTIEGGSDSSDASSRPVCSICLDDLSVGSEVTRMPCSHVYHNHCIVKWLKTCNTCPLCRSII